MPFFHSIVRAKSMVGRSNSQPEGRGLRLLGGARVGVGRVDEGFRRNAADVEAGTAYPAIQATLLHQHDIEAELAGPYRADITAGPTAHDQNLGTDIGHLTPL